MLSFLYYFILFSVFFLLFCFIYFLAILFWNYFCCVKNFALFQAMNSILFQEKLSWWIYTWNPKASKACQKSYCFIFILSWHRYRSIFLCERRFIAVNSEQWLPITFGLNIMIWTPRICAFKRMAIYATQLIPHWIFYTNDLRKFFLPMIRYQFWPIFSKFRWT